MYGWIWRRLPFGLPGKIVGSVLLLAAVGALLWYQVFPAVEPLLPFDDAQVTDGGGAPGAPGVEPTGDPGGQPPVTPQPNR